MIKVEDVFVVFFPGTPLERVALRGVNFSLKEGEVVSILGNNGSGRSTLLKFLAGHITASFGRVWLDKVDMTGQSLSQRSQYFSAVFYDEDVGTAGNLTVAENLAIATMHHQSRSIIYPAIDFEMRDMFHQQLKDLDFMGLDLLMDEKVCNLSKAQRHVLSLLISIIKETKVLLIDEHSTGLDRDSSSALLEATEKIIRSKNMTTIMAISDPQFALRVSDRILVLSHGQIVSNIEVKDNKNIKLEDIFVSFNVVAPIKDIVPPAC